MRLKARFNALVAVVAAVIVTAAAMYLPPRPLPPETKPELVWFTTFENGSGFGDILTHFEVGTFPIRAAVDPEAKVLFVGYANGSIRWWNFSNESSITSGNWTTSDYTCTWGGLEVTPEHMILTGCGSFVSMFFQNGSLVRTLEFSAEVKELEVADGAGKGAIPGGVVFVGLEAGLNSSVVVRAFETGEVLSTLTGYNEPSGRQVRALSASQNGNTLGVVWQNSTHVYDLVNGTDHPLGFRHGALAVPRMGSHLWAMKDGGWDQDIDDQMLVFDAASDPTLLRKFGISSANTGYLGWVHVLETNRMGTEAAYFTTNITTLHYSDDTARRAGESRASILVYGIDGELVRGMQVSGGVVSLALLDDGTIYVVTMLRKMGGSDMWFSRGTPDCTPPTLVRHNVTA